MKEYIEEIERLLSLCDENDMKIIRSVYTILLTYLEKRGRA